jgi:hypothetical protein
MDTDSQLTIRNEPSVPTSKRILGFFFSAEFSEISLVTVNLVTLREMMIPLKKNSVKFEFQVQNKGLDPGACFIRLVGWRVVVANLAAGSRRSRVRVILPEFFLLFWYFLLAGRFDIQRI